MKAITTLVSCILIAGCVSTDCVSDCYFVELRKYDPDLDYKCSTGSVDPRCGGREGTLKMGY
ncbi:hypothetical protein SAMN05216605_108255 [Pseudomonas abietaniphila]|jgi:hypothetical protein|uniref:Lipoprotein n=1 Tax=Pseudomonas abietaniphila TaxID=89065 RepID=A0A1G8FMR6_9PSED|nr:hypothetical protein SAMN05216605_108255 [Pseudomonas abietaniphila]